MIGDENILFVTDEEGNEVKMEILLTFENPTTHKQYVLFTNPNEEDDEVYAYEYDEDGNLNEIDDPEVFSMCEEVLSAYQDEDSFNAKN